MLAITFLGLGAIGIFFLNWRQSEAIAPVDRISFSLVVAAIAALPASLFALFIPTFVLLIAGIIGLMVPIKDFYIRRNARRKLLLELATRNTVEGAVVEGLCPNCDVMLPTTAKSCPKCGADFGPGSSWKVDVV